MPPEDRPQPSREEVGQLTRWIKSARQAEDCGRTFDPGRVTIRRLNRAEYNNTIRDLVGIDFHPADDFPSDDVGYGFDNIGDVLSMPPILLEKYLAAAETISEEAIVAGAFGQGPDQDLERRDARRRRGWSPRAMGHSILDLGGRDRRELSVPAERALHHPRASLWATRRGPSRCGWRCGSTARS